MPRTRTVTRPPAAQLCVDAPPARRSSVPVTTVPLPFAAKTRSIHRRGRPTSAAAGVSATSRVEGRPQLVETDAVGGADRDDRGVVEERAGDVVARRRRLQLAPLVVDEVDLGERDDAVPQPEQLEDAQVLLALRLPALGGGDDEHAGVDAADTGEHVAQEPHVAGHVDEADAVSARQHGRARSRGRW